MLFSLVPVIWPMEDVWAINIAPLPIPDLSTTVEYPTEIPVIVGGFL